MGISLWCHISISLWRAANFINLIFIFRDQEQQSVTNKIKERDIQAELKKLSKQKAHLAIDDKNKEAEELEKKKQRVQGIIMSNL